MTIHIIDGQIRGQDFIAIDEAISRHVQTIYIYDA